MRHHKQAVRWSDAVPACRANTAILCLAAASLWASWEPPSVSAAADTPSSAGNQVISHTFRPAKTEMTAEAMQDLRLPPGYQINVFATGLGNPRMLAVAGDGAVLVTRTADGKVTRLLDSDADGKADERKDIIPQLPEVHGIAVFSSQLYLATTRSLFRGALLPDGTVPSLQKIGTDLPDGGQHPKRTLAIGPFDGQLYISIGSTCNNCVESNPEHASLLKARPDGSGRTPFATGLRNTLGFGWHPQTGELWGMDHGSDDRGDDLPPEELNRLVEGANYGWPFCYGNRVVDMIANPPRSGTKEEHCARSVAPQLVYQAHSAPIGMVFYSGTQFPVDCRNDAYVAMRGSWNRSPATGYKIVRIRFQNGQPVRFEDFLTGFLSADGTRHYGRLAGMAVAKDGALLFSDDTQGTIYRVSYSLLPERVRPAQ